MFSAWRRALVFWYRRGKKTFQLPHVYKRKKKRGGWKTQRRRGGGGHDEEINMRKSERKREKSRGEGGGDKKGGGDFDFLWKHCFQFSSAFYSNYVSKQLPYAGHKLGFAVAGCLNRQAYSLRLLTWLCGSILFPILKRNKFCHFQPCHYTGIFY